MINIVPMSTPVDPAANAEALKRRRRIAESLAGKAVDSSPVQHWSQAANRVAKAWLNAFELRDIDDQEKAGAAEVAKIAAGLLSGGAPAPATPAASSASPSAASPSLPATPASLLPRFAQTEAQYGLPPNFLSQTANIESRFNPNAKNPNSSASGLFQFTKGTARQYGLSNPFDPVASTDAAGRLAADNKATLMRALGREPSAGELYLAHQQGGGGASRLLSNPNARAVDIVGRDAVRLNGGHEGMSAGEFARRWTDKLVSNEADIPAASAVPVSMDTGQEGYAVPQPEAPVPATEGQPMTPQTFQAIAAALDAQPQSPVFQSEGLSQPWMGTALPEVAQQPEMVAAPLPPPRPADLAQADLPAPGAVPAIGQMPPPVAAPMPDLSNSPDGGARAFALAEGQRAAGQPSGDAITRIANFLGGQQQAAPAPSSPAVQRVAAAVQGEPAVQPPAVPAAAPVAAQTAAPGVPDVATAMRIINHPYSNPAQRAVAQSVLERALRDPQDAELKRLQLDRARRDAEAAPLDREAKQLDIDAKKKALGKVEAPTTKVVKQPDGSEVALQWDPGVRKWVPLDAPSGGNAVTGAPGNPYALPGKPTEGQSKDAGFAGRMVESHNIISGLEGVGANRWETAKSAVPLFGNSIISGDRQQFEQARRNFITAILRKESGAAIAQTEFDEADKNYFPMPGDSPATIEQKRAARELAIEGVMAGAGSGYKVPDSYKPRRSVDPSKPSPVPGASPDRAAMEAEARRRGLIK